MLGTAKVSVLVMELERVLVLVLESERVLVLVLESCKSNFQDKCILSLMRKMAVRRSWSKSRSLEEEGIQMQGLESSSKMYELHLAKQ